MEERWQVLVGLSPGHILDSPVSGCLLCFLSLESLCVYILKATWTNRFVGALGQIKWPFNFYELVSCEGNAPEWEWNCTRLENKKQKTVPGWKDWLCSSLAVLKMQTWKYSYLDLYSLTFKRNQWTSCRDYFMYTFFSFAFLRIIINFF